MAAGYGFAKGFARGMEKNFREMAAEEKDAAAIAAARYEKNRENFFEQEKEDQKKIDQAEQIIQQLYPNAASRDQEARKTDAVQLLRAGNSFKDTLALMEDRVYEAMKEEEKKEQKEVKVATETPTESSKVGDVVNQTNEMLSSEDVTKAIETTTDQKPEVKVEKPEEKEEEKPGFFDKLKESAEARKQRRIDKRVDKLTGTTREVRETVSGTWQPTRFTDPSGTKFSLKVGKKERPSVWDLYYDQVVGSESYKQADEATRVQMLILAEEDYKNSVNNKGYNKSTYINEVNRFEAIVDENNAEPGKYSKAVVDNANFMLSVILPKRKARLDLFTDEKDKNGGTKSDKDLPEYNVFIKNDQGNIEQRVGKHTTVFATDEMITTHGLQGVEKGDEIDVYKFAGNRVIPFDSPLIDNAETTGRQEQRQKLGNQLNNDKLYLDIVEKRTAASSMAKQALMLDGLVEQDEDILRLGGDVNRFFNELTTDVNSVLELFKGQELSESQADELVNNYFDNLPVTESERSIDAKNHRLYTMRLIKFAYASSRADGNYGQGLSDTDLRLKLESIQGAKDYDTFSKSLKALVNDSFAEIDEMLGGFVKQGNVIEYQQLGGNLAVNNMQQEAEEYGWNDAYTWSQSSVEDWKARNKTTSTSTEETTEPNKNEEEQKTEKTVVIESMTITQQMADGNPALQALVGKTIRAYSDGTFDELPN